MRLFVFLRAGVDLYRASYLHNQGLVLATHGDDTEQNWKVAGFPAESRETSFPPPPHQSSSSAADRHECVPEIPPSAPPLSSTLLFHLFTRGNAPRAPASSRPHRPPFAHAQYAQQLDSLMKRRGRTQVGPLGYH